MTVRYETDGNKYVQYRLMSDTFNVTENNWQKQGAEVTVSQNTSTGHTEINIGNNDYPIPSLDDIAKIVNGGETIINNQIQLTTGAAWNSSGGTSIPSSPSSISNWSYAKFEVHSGDKVTLRGEGGNSTIRWFITNATNSSIIEVCDIQGYVTVEEIVNISADGYFYFTSKDECNPYVTLTSNTTLNGLVKDEKDISTLQQDINTESSQRQSADNTLSGMINSESQRAQNTELILINGGTNINNQIQLTTGAAWNSGGGTVIPSSPSPISNWSYAKFEVHSGDKVTLRGNGGSSTIRWFITNATNTAITDVCDIQNGVTVEETVNISADGYFYFTSKDECNPYVTLTFNITLNGLVKDEKDISTLQKDIHGEQETTDLTQQMIPNKVRMLNGTKVSYLVDSEGWCSIYIDVEEGDIVRVKGIGGSTTKLWATADENDNIKRTTESSYTYTEETITINQGESKFCFNNQIQSGKEYFIKVITITGGLINNVNALTKDVDALKEEVDYDLARIPYLFNIVSPNYNRKYVQKCYIEGCLSKKAPVKFNGSDFYTVFSSLPSNQNSEINFSRELYAAGYKKKSISGKQYNVSPNNAVNKNIRLLCIGDSWAEANQPYPDGVYKGGWAWPSCIKEFTLLDNEDFGNINVLMVGSLNNKTNRTIHYNNKDIAIRSFSEGRSGWTSTGYNQYPFPVKVGGVPTNGMLSIQSLWYASGLATMTPFDSSTPGKTWESWTNSKSQRKLIVETPYGRYKPDVASVDAAFLWDELKNRFSSFTGTGEYTASAEQQALIINFLNGLADICANPFYDSNKAKAYTGNHVWTYDTAFSIGKYLERYRTMDDLGIRLIGSAGETVQGSDGETYTIGTKVANTSDYDVCEPTHIFDGMGVNDETVGYPDLAAEAINLTLDEIENYGIQVGWGYGHRQSLFYNRDNMYSNVIGNVKSFFDQNELMIDALGETITPNKAKSFVPIYQFTSCVGNANCSYAEELDSDKKSIVFSSDYVHPSIFGHRSIAYQVLGWLYYTLMS